MFIGLLAFLTACGGSATTDAEVEAEVEEAQEELEDTLGEEAENAIPDTASEVVTTLADVNGFKIVTAVLNPRGYDYYGTEVEITAFVKDHSNNNVADGTVVTFIADDNGMIEDQCATENGTCSVKWWSSRDRSEPVSPDPNSGDDGYVNDFLITIMARTIGEDSFINKNDSSDPLFEVGETFLTQSEAFLDANDNGVFDTGVNDFDEYFDYNGDGSFNLASEFTLFRGVSCSSTAKALGHCGSRIEVWDSITLINSSGGDADMELTNCSGTVIAKTVNGDQVDPTSTITLASATNFCLEVTDLNGNIPPIATAIEVTTDNGVIDVSPTEVGNIKTSIGSGFFGDIRIKPDALPSSGTMVLKTESVNGSVVYMYVTVTD